LEIEVANGDVVDRWVIIKIKLRHAAKRKVIDYLQIEERYLSLLVDSLELPPHYIEELEVVNSAIWKLEDEIRMFEVQKKFDSDFIETARQIYLNNDVRFRIKNAINQETNSIFQEQKLLPKYD
jgi:hypothetical protein